ncbi:MAG: hypothetical protein HKN53_07415 [Maribacter sp.]|nr:hypothetical protein [Maribacter sp.]
MNTIRTAVRRPKHTVNTEENIVKNLISITVFLSSVFLSNYCLSEGYSDVTTVEGLSIGNNFARVKLAKMKDNIEGCYDSQKFYHLDITSKFGKMAYATLLAAKMSSHKVFLQLIGCVSIGSKEYPSISHVYACDQRFCK